MDFINICSIFVIAIEIFKFYLVTLFDIKIFINIKFVCKIIKFNFNN